MKSDQFIKEIRNKTQLYFSNKGFVPHKCGYILEKLSDWHNNIIEPSVVTYIQNEIKNRNINKNGKTFALHKYIHHGLSSQACLFNLLGPFIANGSYNILRDIINLSGLNLKGQITNVILEHTDRDVLNERQLQPTSIDLYIETNSEEKVIGEFKFTEFEFGTCSVYECGDCDGANPKLDSNLCYLHKIKDRKYMDLMNKYSLFWNDSSCQFTEFYQAYRLLLFALEENGYFLLIYDERNPAFIYDGNGIPRGKFIRFLTLLPANIKAKVFKLSIQQIVGYLETNVNPPWLNEFKDKYI